MANLIASISRLFVGFAGATLIGIPLGLAMGSNARVQAVIDPWLQFYKPLPPLAYLGLMILWFGVGEPSKDIIVGLAGLPPVTIATAAAVDSVRIERIQGAQSLGLKGLTLFRYVILPSCLPDILTGVRVAFGITYTTLIGAEMIATSSGIAWMILAASNQLQTSIVIVGLIIMGVTGAMVDVLLRVLQGRLTPWAGKG